MLVEVSEQFICKYVLKKKNSSSFLLEIILVINKTIYCNASYYTTISSDM